MIRGTAAAAAFVLAVGMIAAVPAAAAGTRPTITGMSAHSGPLSGGATVTVYGRHLKATRRVTLASGRATFHVVSDSRVRVRIPRSSRRGVTHVYLFTGHGYTAASVHSRWTYIGAPTVSRSSVAVGPTAGGTRVTLTGYDLYSVQRVTFGTTPARIVSRAAPTAVTVDAPRHVAGTVVVQVTTPYGVSRTATHYSYLAPPVVSSPPTFVSQAGGPVSVDGSGFTGVRVTVDGQKAAVLSGGTASSIRFAAPAHAPGLAPVVLTTAGGSVTTQLLYESNQGAAVTDLPGIDVYHGEILGLSCPSTTFCVAVDHVDAVTYDGSRWSQPSPVGLPVLDGVSCASEHFCVAFGGAAAAIFDGSGWTRTDPGVPQGMAISCPIDGYCVLAGVAASAVLDGGTWRPVGNHPVRFEGDIACVSVSFCLAVGDRTQWLFDGTTWTSSAVVSADGTTPSYLSDVSCSSDVDCTAVDLYGSLWRYADGNWSLSRSLPDGGWRAISCGAPEFCVVSDDMSTALATADGVPDQRVDFDWPYEIDRFPRLRVSCATAMFCVATSHWGDFSIWDGTAWSTPANVTEPVGSLTSIACVSRTECFAGDNLGTVVPYLGSSWGEPERVDPWRLGRTIVACSSTGLCAVVSEHGIYRDDVSDGTAAVYDGATWHATRRVLDGAIAISCGGTRCMAVSARQYSTYDAAGDATWSAAAALPPAGPGPGGDAVSVACTAATDCVVTFGSGYSHYDGHAWSTVAPISQQVGTGRVGCATAGPCLARNSGYSVLRSADGRWGSLIRTADRDPNGDIAEACGGSTCLSLSGSGFQLYSHGTWAMEQSLPTSYGYLVGATCVPDGTCTVLRSGGTVYQVTPAGG